MHTTASHSVHGAFRSTTEQRQAPPRRTALHLSVAPAVESEREDLWAAVSDSLATHLAVLDETGTILAVNRAWTEFAVANDARNPIGAGWNYLDACDAAGDDEPGAAEVGSLIRAIIGGADVDGITEYPCHSPHEQRWFAVRVAPYFGQGQARVVVGHTDITERVLLGDELRRTNDFLRAVTQSIGEGLLVVTASGRLSYVNEAAVALLGFEPGALEGEPMYDSIRYRREDGSLRPVRECAIAVCLELNESISAQEDVFVRADGSLLPIALSVSPFESPSGERGAVVVFRDITVESERARLLDQRLADIRWEERIRIALAGDNFVLHAQPIASVADRESKQYELLIRMREGETLLAPGEFLPVAERLGLISDIDLWVVAQAIEFACRGDHVGVNLSAISLGRADVIGQIERAIEESGVDPRRLTFEITETAVMVDLEQTAAALSRLRALGCPVALDDFGTGYAGFTYLKNLPIDQIKIDREFVSGLPGDEAGRHVVAAVVGLARTFGLSTIGEGVETEEALAALTEMGVDYAQGYLLGRPAPAGDVLASGDRPVGAGG